MIRTASVPKSLRRRLGDVAVGMAAGAALAFAAIAAFDDQSREAAEAAPPATAGPTIALPARALHVIDGDTFEARVATFPGQEIVARVRIAGLDAPERNARCAGEAEAAEVATAALAGLIDGRRLTLTAVKGDKYFGRVVARVSGDGLGDVAERLIAEGHGRAYAGGRRTGWC